jgi:peptidoglycan/xylan/chitin deacetylase (PgdA/CDA1 family)
MDQEPVDVAMTMRTSDFKKPIFVLLYHPWLEGFEDTFTAHLSWLKDRGFESLPLETLVAYVKGEEARIPNRPIVITLDDGTTENVTIAYPLLKRFGYNGVVFAPTADRYIRMSGNGWWKQVESEGVLRIEGHSHTHSLIFINDQVEDFFIRESLDRKPIIKGLEEMAGAPIFGLGYELVSRRFIPDPELIERCIDYVKSQGMGFDEHGDWRKDLMSLVSVYERPRGRYETDEERRDRIREELERSKTFIENVLGGGKEVRFLAYPFGAYDFDIVDYLAPLGYMGAFTVQPGGNYRGDNPYLLKRMNIENGASFGGLESILVEYLEDGQGLKK